VQAPWFKSSNTEASKNQRKHYKLIDCQEAMTGLMKSSYGSTVWKQIQFLLAPIGPLYQQFHAITELGMCL
jgi:hypothetical protein